MAAARARPAAWACALLLLLTGCTYAAEEPGLFPTPGPRTTAAEAPRERFQPRPTDPRLPVVAERMWVSGYAQAPIVVRIAVHAVRRTAGATVLDWSITAVSAEGFSFGDSLAGIEFGLTRPGTQNAPAVALVDPGAARSYAPLTHRSRSAYNHCLCTPLWVLQPSLRLGETRLLQIAYPELPASLDFVDVTLATVAPVRHVPVTPEGSAPIAGAPTDLARVEPVTGPRPAKLDFRNPNRTRQRQRIQAIRVLSAPGRSTLEWSLTTLDPQDSRVQDYEPPVTSAPPATRNDIANAGPANGPVLRIGSRRLSNLWARTTVNGRTAYDCLCTEIGLWASGLRFAGVSVGLVTNYPALPPATRAVDVEVPGLGTLKGVPVVELEDAAIQAGPPEPAEVGRWTYSVEDPPRGWSTADWPTDLPDPEQLADFKGAIEPLLTLPTVG